MADYRGVKGSHGTVDSPDKVSRSLNGLSLRSIGRKRDNSIPEQLRGQPESSSICVLPKDDSKFTDQDIPEQIEGDVPVERRSSIGPHPGRNSVTTINQTIDTTLPPIVDEEVSTFSNVIPLSHQSLKQHNVTHSTSGNLTSTSSATSSAASSMSSTNPTASHLSYEAVKVIGHGSFGMVFLARISESDECVAIKKVLQDRRFKNRELQIMKTLSKKPHPNIVHMKQCFYTNSTSSSSSSSLAEAQPTTGDVYLNLVLEYVPETVHSVVKFYVKQLRAAGLVGLISPPSGNSDPLNQGMVLPMSGLVIPDIISPVSSLSGSVPPSVVPFPIVKLFAFQLLRALTHLHGLGICHRDIKPHNLLINPATWTLKLCDFGSAKCLVKGELNVAYICSRYYRAPELIFGSNDYSCAIDVWSAGCVIAELFLGTPLFPGNSGVDQLVEIVKVMGTPSKLDVSAMNPNYKEFKFPLIRAHSWHRVIKCLGSGPTSAASSSMMVQDTVNSNSSLAIAASLSMIDSTANVTDSSSSAAAGATTEYPLDEEAVYKTSAIDLIDKLLVYNPAVRIDASRALSHEWFDFSLGSTARPANLMDFTDIELAANCHLNNLQHRQHG